jgi:hypothetical protein
LAWAAPQTCQNIFPVESQLQRLGNFSPQSCGARATASFFTWAVGFPACARGAPFSIIQPTGPSWIKALCAFCTSAAERKLGVLFMHQENRRVRREYPCLITSMHVRQRQHCSKWQKQLPIPTSRPGLCKPPPVRGSAGLKIRGPSGWWSVGSFPQEARALHRTACRSLSNLRTSIALLLDCSDQAPHVPDLPPGL